MIEESIWNPSTLEIVPLISIKEFEIEVLIGNTTLINCKLFEIEVTCYLFPNSLYKVFHSYFQGFLTRI